MANETKKDGPKVELAPEPDTTPPAKPEVAVEADDVTKLYGAYSSLSVRGELVPQDADGAFLVKNADVADFCASCSLSLTKPTK
jgi:hypothetical protein